MQKTWFSIEQDPRINWGPTHMQSYSDFLSRAKHFRTGMYSVQAGFVEVGETLEETVKREIREEVGIEIKNISYFGSQAWAFPNSLMVAFTAEYARGELKVNHAELEEASWYQADNLPLLPSHKSIARRLIESFLASLH